MDQTRTVMLGWGQDPIFMVQNATGTGAAYTFSIDYATRCHCGAEVGGGYGHPWGGWQRALVRPTRDYEGWCDGKSDSWGPTISASTVPDPKLTRKLIKFWNKLELRARRKKKA